MAGITDPLQQLDLHALLDVVEMLIEETLDKEGLEKLRRDLYRPEAGAPDPAGFTPKEELAGFAAFRASLASLSAR